MDVCVLTGADSEGGISLARLLVERGFRVYGLVGEQRNWGFEHPDFVPLEFHADDRAQLEAILQAVLDHEGGIFAVIHMAHTFSAQSFREMDPERIESLVFRNLTMPLVVNKVLLSGVIQERGHFVQCCLPVGKGARLGGTLYMTLEDGMQRFYRRLYEEVRNSGVRVSCLRPYGVVGHDQEPGQGISGDFLAQTIVQVLSQGEGSFFSDLEIRPEPPLKVGDKIHPPVAIHLSSMRLPPVVEKDSHKKSFSLPARKSMAPKKKLQWADRPIDYGPAPEVFDEDDDEDEDDWDEKSASQTAEKQQKPESAQQHGKHGHGRHSQRHEHRNEQRHKERDQRKPSDSAGHGDRRPRQEERKDAEQGAKPEVVVRPEQSEVRAEQKSEIATDRPAEPGHEGVRPEDESGNRNKRRRRRRRRGKGRGDRDEHFRQPEAHSDARPKPQAENSPRSEEAQHKVKVESSEPAPKPESAPKSEPAQKQNFEPKPKPEPEPKLEATPSQKEKPAVSETSQEATSKPARKTAAKKTAAKKVTAKKITAEKPAAKKTAPRKSARKTASPSDSDTAPAAGAAE